MSAATTPTTDSQALQPVFLAADDLKPAASILFQAYYDDPLFMDIFRSDDEGYDSRLRAAIREELKTFWEADQPMIGLFEQGRLVAVACVVRPDSNITPNRFWHWRLKMLLTAGYIGTRQMVEKEQRVRSHIPYQRYHMLSFIGVHPDHQHHGLGHFLMSAIDSIVQDDQNSEGIAVFVTLPKCLSFFQHDRYQMLSELSVSRIQGHLMFRPRQEAE